ncbi:MAG TPA: FAD-dependent oxidoreductase [Sorangium sp.]|nr:FAD-dependent oxidoreductase [Sorangium sp.]
MNTVHQQPAREERVPVLVVGGGLVGLSTALFLARHGVRSLVLEKHASTAIHPRARGFNARTIELLRAAGVGEEVEREGSSFADGQVVGSLTAETLSGPILAWQPFGRAARGLDLSPCPIVALGQDRLEPILLRGARAQGVEVRFGHRVLAFEQGEDCVTADVEELSTGARYRARAGYLVGADGARSPVREALGIPRSGRGSLGHAISTLFHADLSPFRREHPFFFATITHPDGAGVIVGTDVKDRWLYGTPYDPARESPADFTEERWLGRIRAAAGAPDLAVTIAGTFPWEVAERVADRYGAGRVFLAGDAVHQMPPTGGFGANTGIQDAANLAWKLAAVVRGQAGAGLLATYDAERRPVGVATANQAALLALKMRLNGPGGAATFDREGELLDAAVVIFGHRYGFPDPMPRALELTGAPGTRAPHVWLAQGDRRTSTIDLLGDGFALLTACPAWAHAAEAVAARTGLPLRERRADGFQAAYGVGPTGASLVRPDGFVAARWPDERGALERALAEALDAALHRCDAALHR